MSDEINAYGEHPGSFRLWLVRHGATIWNAEGRFCGASDIPLSPQGEQQARWLSQQLQPTKIAAIYSSDLLRARQTAEQIAQQLPVQSTALWRELAFGRWEGLTYAEITALPENDLRFFSDALQFAPPGGESLMALNQRVQQAFTLLVAATHAHKSPCDVILVSHGGPLRVLLCQLLHVPLTYQWQFQLAPGSLSALDLSP
ncbi:MAG TPA: histidine phosphatase family protein, partial [Ktedonobacteraceae bacterium]